MTVKYDPDLESKLPDLEVLRLRQEVAELKRQLELAQAVLEENGLADSKPKDISTEEKICLKQIELLGQVSEKGLPFATEDFKNLETVVKTLLSIRGKPIPEEKKSKKKKEEEPDIAKLLSIVTEK
jgi:hypothetical protein